MAQKKTDDVNAEKQQEEVNVEKQQDELVEIRLFKDGEKYRDDVIVAVNGKLWQIQRGVKVKVPKCVAEVLENSEMQDAKTADMIDKYTKNFEERKSALT